MEVCGGQTHTIVKYGIDRLLPPEVELVHGPGCPVCVTSLEMIDRAHAIASRPDVIFCSFGDMLRVPGLARRPAAAQVAGERRAGRLLAARRREPRGGQPRPRRWSSSPSASRRPPRPTPWPSGWRGKRRLTNFSVLVSHVLVPPAMTAILQAPGNRVQGFLGPGHVCTVMGYDEYEPIAERYRVPDRRSPASSRSTCSKACCATVRQLEAGRAEVENQYAPGRAAARGTRRRGG